MPGIFQDDVMKRYRYFVGISCLVFVLSFFSSFVAADVWDGYPVILWTNQGSLIQSDGRNGNVDVQRTVDAFHDMGATAFYIHFDSGNNYEKLNSYLEKFKNTDIKTWVVMNGQCWDVQPYPKDCKTHMRELAKVSLNYPNFEAVTLDDYHVADSNPPILPETIRELIAIKDSVNPEFKFIPTLYSDVWNINNWGEIKYFMEGNAYDGVFKDGTTMWYWSSFTKTGPTMTDFKARVDKCNEEIPPFKFITGLYAFRTGKYTSTMNLDDQFHDPQLLYDLTKYGKENSDGFGLFYPPIYMYDTDFFMKSTMFQQQTNDDSSYDYMVSSPKSTFISWYQGMKTTVDGGNVRVQFDMKDSRSDGGCESSKLYNYQYKQLVINDEVVWESDICNDSNVKFSIDKSVSVDGKADISIRLFSKRDNHINTKVYIDNPRVYVNGNLVSSEWKFDSNLSRFDDYLATYNAIKNGLKGSSLPVSSCGNGVCNSGECSSCKGDCFISQCSSDGKCLSGYKDGGESCSNSNDCGVCEIKGKEVIGNWSMDSSDLVSGKMIDGSSENRDLNVVGNPEFVQGFSGEALRFDGDDYLQFDGSGWGGGEMTFLARIKPEVSMEKTFRGVAAKAQSGKSDWSWQIRFNGPGGYLGFQGNDVSGGSKWASLNENLSLNKWYHVAGRFNGSAISLFVDGEEVSSVLFSGMVNSSSDFFVGMEGWSGNNFIGQIDDVLFYNYGLTSEEIREIFESGGGCVLFSKVVDDVGLWREGVISLNDLLGFLNDWRKRKC
jgi:hypothetical protein